MTAIRDRQSDPDADEVAVRWDERPVVGDRRGLPWWGAVLLAFGLAVIGAVADMQIQNSLGWVFKICYFVGSVGAVCAVQRRSLFGPMVQPPLILAITVPAVVLLVSGLPANSDTLSKILTVGTPLINGFPTMAVTTGLTLVVGIVRLYRERDPDAPVKGARPGDKTRVANQAGARDAAGARSGRPGRGGPGRPGAGREGTGLREGPAGRGRGPGEGGPQGPRNPGNEHPSLPMTRRQRPEDDAAIPRGGLRGRRGGEPGGRRGGPEGRVGGAPGDARDVPRRGAEVPGGPDAAGRGGPGGRGSKSAGREPRRGRAGDAARGGESTRGAEPGRGGHGSQPARGDKPGRAGEPGRGGVGGRGGDPARGGDAPSRGRFFGQSRRASDDGGPRRGGEPRSRGERADGDGRRGGDARSSGAPGGDRPRRMPPRSGEPRGGAPGEPGRGPSRRGGAPRRPWDDEA
ncbi:DUF6542 domain-containing protein [Amycolatopsis acididurans]|uniref:DUF6542 domain-containing protein n=1 Tax=Amycolatopsis acididurans TaxID=2724524 RepID=UPI0028AC281E|nr:DUF6542 domain-containing protein [Amycolatopsis acididurans]